MGQQSSTPSRDKARSLPHHAGCRGKDVVASAAFQKPLHNARLLSTRSVRWKFEEVRPFLQGGSSQGGGANDTRTWLWEPGLSCFTWAKQWEEEEEGGQSHLNTPRNKTSNLFSLQKNKPKQRVQSVFYGLFLPGAEGKWGIGFSLSTSPLGHE